MQELQETRVQSLVQEDPLEEGMATHSLGNPMDRGAWQTTVFRVAKNQTWLKRLSMQACKQHVGLTLVAQWSRICLPMQGTQVQPLVGELRSHMPWSNQAYVLLLLKHPWTVHLMLVPADHLTFPAMKIYRSWSSIPFTPNLLTENRYYLQSLR